MLEVADAARDRGCKEAARRLYDAVIGTYTGSASLMPQSASARRSASTTCANEHAKGEAHDQEGQGPAPRAQAEAKGGAGRQAPGERPPIKEGVLPSPPPARRRREHRRVAAGDGLAGAQRARLPCGHR